MKYIKKPFHEIVLFLGFGIRKAGSMQAFVDLLDISRDTVDSWLIGTHVPTQKQWKKLRQYVASDVVNPCFDATQLECGGVYAIVVPKKFPLDAVEGFMNELKDFVFSNQLSARFMALPCPVEELTPEKVSMVEEIFEIVPSDIG